MYKLIITSLTLTTILILPKQLLSKSVYSTYISEGMSFYKLEYYEKAIENFEKAIELNPTDPLPYRMIGLCYYRKNSFDKAIKYLSTSLTLENKDNPITLSIIGNIYFKQKKYNNSVIVYKKLLTITNNAFVCYRLIKSLEKVGKLEEAVEVGERFLYSPNWEEFDEKTFKSELRSLYIKLGNKYKNLKNETEYKKFIEKAKNLN